MDAELEKLRAEIAAIKQQNAATPDHPRLLRGADPRLLHRPAAEGSWLAAADQSATASSQSRGCRTTDGEGFVDYVLWGDDGKPLGLVEAKRTKPQSRRKGSSRPSSMPTAWRSSSASAR